MTHTHRAQGGSLLQPQESLQRNTVHYRPVLFTFSVARQIRVRSRRFTQAGLSSVCDKFLRRGVAQQVEPGNTFGFPFDAGSNPVAIATTFAAMHSLNTGERMARRKRAGLFPAYVHSPQADGPGSTRRHVRRLLAGLFCSCGVEGHATDRPIDLGRALFRPCAGSEFGQPQAAGFESGHEHPVSPSRSGNCIASPFRAIAFHAAAGCLMYRQEGAA